VITLNLNRLAQKYSKSKSEFFDNLKEYIRDIHRFHVALRSYVKQAVDNRLLPVYDAGFISLDKQFSTLGITGLNEAAEYYGMEAGNNPAYLQFCQKLLSVFKEENIEAKKLYGFSFNTEFIPGESVGPKMHQWDVKDGLKTGQRVAYNSYMYLPESADTSIPDKFKMHGACAGYLDGGSALHLNLSQLPDKEFFLWLRTLAAKHGTSYWTTNVKTTFCVTCGHIDYRTLETCPKCGSNEIEYATRPIGYLKKIKSFSEDRQTEESMRFYH
jgi:ribonucleoside-triphosphate reductase